MNWPRKSQYSRTTIHVACNVVAKDPNILLVGTERDRKIVGSEGTLYTALGIHEAVNFQTVLDNSTIRLSKALDLTIAYSVLFIQLYVDSPHINVKSPFKHPVSGTIVTCGLSHPQYTTALETRATTYLGHMQDLSSKVICPFHLRLEYVLLLKDTSYPECLKPCLGVGSGRTLLWPPPELQRCAIQHKSGDQLVGREQSHIQDSSALLKCW